MMYGVVYSEDQMFGHVNEIREEICLLIRIVGDATEHLREALELLQ